MKTWNSSKVNVIFITLLVNSIHLSCWYIKQRTTQIFRNYSLDYGINLPFDYMQRDLSIWYSVCISKMKGLI